MTGRSEAALIMQNAAAMAEAKGQLAAKAAEIARLRDALEEIESPLAAMQRRAEADGCVLNGVMANQIANDPEHLRRIARRALQGIQG